ncbi:MAG: glutamate synthase large subunit [Myxococcales bacterium]|nr:glutamate synthase large subunit [Myxococcales bacterium]
MRETARSGLYDPRDEHDACGLGFVADLGRGKSHDVVQRALLVLGRLAHRGASGADPMTGDGAGVLLDVPHAYLDRLLGREGKELPPPGDYGVAQVFLSRDADRRRSQMRTLEAVARYHSQKVIGWRDVPIDESKIGHVGLATMPVMRQFFVARMCEASRFEQVLFLVRKRAGSLCSKGGFGEDFYVASFSSRTIVYKGLMLPELLGEFYEDLSEPEVQSRFALVHSRFSTNTFPTWERAHPYRRIAHNGEINTLRGNQGWMRSRSALLASDAFGEHLGDFKPIIREGGSDSASLDNLVDFLVASGRSIPHVMMMLVPEAYGKDARMSQEKRDFYEYHASLVEPWDGPAAFVFTDGVRLGAMLDRNGLRPAKYVITRQGLVVLASELGVADIRAQDVVEKGRLRPGQMFLVDLQARRVVPDEEVKREVCTLHPYGEWLAANKLDLRRLPDVEPPPPLEPARRAELERVFGYTREDLRLLLAPMAEHGEEPIGSMGNDAALAVLSARAVSFFRYFKQQFAQVTNPPIDPIRENLVMSLATTLGGEGNLLSQTPNQCRLVELSHPLLTPTELRKLGRSPYTDFRAKKLAAVFSTDGEPGAALEEALWRLEADSVKAVDEGFALLVLSDVTCDATMAPVPALLATAAVHNHLVREGRRAKVSLIVETADVREVADVALLVGFGAGAVCPYLALDLVAELASRGEASVTPEKAQANLFKAFDKGLEKILSKMGISTLASYQGAQIFEAIGVSDEVCERWLGGVKSPVSGVGLHEIGEEVRARHATAHAPEALPARAALAVADDLAALDVGGVYAWRVGGEKHLWTPRSVASLQRAVRLDEAASYEEYASLVNSPEAPVTLRHLWELRPDRAPVPLDEVEPATELVKRFATGAMSFGSISKEAHENLAIAMNRVGGKSNTGEGGEDEARFARDPNGDLRRSAIKQVASGRFGVTSHYLVNADEIQIKMAQGAKPGEGGQLPGHKVDAVIARVRHSTPGVTLISPPPHHDIYSIEDLAQLIFDLKNVNPRARISVKLVSESGVGTVAAGVAKAHADAILIAGHDGGTGASPLSSLQHAGTPWEIGLSEAQQVLVMNGLRSRVVLQADGQLKTGRDVVFAALLGAEEFGFATAPLVASGCVMMRKCHLNTCPVGIATQDPTLRARFVGTPEHVVRYFFFVAEEVRGLLAGLGFRSLREAVGQRQAIGVRASISSRKARTLDFSRVLAPAAPAVEGGLRHETDQDHGLSRVLDRYLLDRCERALARGEPVRVEVGVKNSDRTVGAMLGGELSTRHGAKGLPTDTVVVACEGTAGQSFGAFAPRGLTLTLSGDANDYVGKGLSGGVIAVYPHKKSTFVASENVVVGNTVLYGATAGEAYFAGRAGERFCVRNSGAVAVVEGVGDHGCEYMTGGVALVLGTVGRNFGAGMSGGVAYVLDEEGSLRDMCNLQMIELEPLDDDDRARVLALLEAHVARTDSVKGRALLQGKLDAGAPLAPFVKVVPTEYKRVLAAKRAEAARAEVAHG